MDRFSGATSQLIFESVAAMQDIVAALIEPGQKPVENVFPNCIAGKFCHIVKDRFIAPDIQSVEHSFCRAETHAYTIGSQFFDRCLRSVCRKFGGFFCKASD